MPPYRFPPLLGAINSIGVCLGGFTYFISSGPVSRPGALASGGSRAWSHFKRQWNLLARGFTVVLVSNACPHSIFVTLLGFLRRRTRLSSLSRRSLINLSATDSDGVGCLKCVFIIRDLFAREAASS